MITLTKKSIDKVKEFKLHDSEINEITNKYEDAVIIIPVEHYYFKKRMLLKFENVIYSQISFYELWGKGNYIFQCEIDEETKIMEDLKELQASELKQMTWSRLCEIGSLDDFFVMTLLLNSGDKIIVVTNKVTLSDAN